MMTGASLRRLRSPAKKTILSDDILPLQMALTSALGIHPVDGLSPWLAPPSAERLAFVEMHKSLGP